jgi:hypothetical protein
VEVLKMLEDERENIQRRSCLHGVFVDQNTLELTPIKKEKEHIEHQKNN